MDYSAILKMLDDYPLEPPRYSLLRLAHRLGIPRIEQMPDAPEHSGLIYSANNPPLIKLGGSSLDLSTEEQQKTMAHEIFHRMLYLADSLLKDRIGWESPHIKPREGPVAPCPHYTNICYYSPEETACEEFAQGLVSLLNLRWYAAWLITNSGAIER